MSLPKGIFDLVPADDGKSGPQGANDRLQQAAALVNDFVQDSGIEALDALLKGAEKGGASGSKKALSAAKKSLQQTAMLEREVKHFLEQTKAPVAGD